MFNKYVKNSNCTSSSLVVSSNVLGNNHVDYSLCQFNVNKVDREGDYDESDTYEWYLSTFSNKGKNHNWTFIWKNYSLSWIVK